MSIHSLSNFGVSTRAETDKVKKIVINYDEEETNKKLVGLRVYPSKEENFQLFLVLCDAMDLQGIRLFNFCYGS